MTNRFDGSTALVTGSSRGIGAATAVRLAAEGASVVVHGRDDVAADAVRDRIRAEGGRAIAVTGDVTDLSQIEAMRERIERELGPVEILVANAGGSPGRPGPLEATREEDWRWALEANLTATFLTIKCFLPGMKERGRGSIVTISSSAARRANSGSPVVYAAAKAGIEVLTKEVAVQAGPYGVRANCIAPETIMTESNQQRIPADFVPSMIERHPIRRLGTPQDVAEAVVFLAGAGASWISGVVLDVTGASVL